MLWTNAIGLDLLGCSEQESSGRSIAGSFVERQVAADILGRLGRGETVKGCETGLRARERRDPAGADRGERPLPRRRTSSTAAG